MACSDTRPNNQQQPEILAVPPKTELAYTAQQTTKKNKNETEKERKVKASAKNKHKAQIRRYRTVNECCQMNAKGQSNRQSSSSSSRAQKQQKQNPQKIKQNMFQNGQWQRRSAHTLMAAIFFIIKKEIKFLQ